MVVASLSFLVVATLKHITGPLALTVFPPHVPQWSLSLTYGSCVIDIAVGAEELSSAFDQLWLSKMISVCCKRCFANEVCEL